MSISSVNDLGGKANVIQIIVLVLQTPDLFPLTVVPRSKFFRFLVLQTLDLSALTIFSSSRFFVNFWCSLI